MFICLMQFWGITKSLFPRTPRHSKFFCHYCVFIAELQGLLIVYLLLRKYFRKDMLTDVHEILCYSILEKQILNERFRSYSYFLQQVFAVYFNFILEYKK